MKYCIFINGKGKEQAKIEIELERCDDIDILNIDHVYYSMTSNIIFIHLYHHAEVSMETRKSKYSHCDAVHTTVTIKGGK